MRDFLEKLQSLRREGQGFATATVVGRRPPVSAHLGDRAIVYPDGRMEGFIGGACSREIVRRQALEAIRDRRPRLVSITPDPAGQPPAGAEGTPASSPEHVVVPMTCVSEGALDVFLEPSVRPRRLIVVGATPVAEALGRAGSALDFDVVRVVASPEVRDLEAQAAASGIAVRALESLAAVAAEDARAAVVVASQGHYDEEALETILGANTAYVGLVASRKRGADVRASLEARGVAGADRIRIPAGLDLGARTAPEVAVSILAEIVQAAPDRSLVAADEQPASGTAAAAAIAEVAIDPVCSMEVEIATARHTAEVGGTTYYFCCARCRRSFLSDPARFAAPPA